MCKVEGKLTSKNNQAAKCASYEGIKPNFKVYAPAFHTFHDQNNAHSHSSSHTKLTYEYDCKFGFPSLYSGILNTITLLMNPLPLKETATASLNMRYLFRVVRYLVKSIHYLGSKHLLSVLKLEPCRHVLEYRFCNSNMVIG